MSESFPSVDPASRAQDELIEAYSSALDILIELARRDINEFVQYVMRDEGTNEPIIQAKTHRRMHSACRRHNRLILWSHVEAGKGVDVRTPILTSAGWSTIGDLTTGSIVYDQHGQPCTVTGKSQVHHIQCYKVKFTDGEELTFDHEHRWVAATADQRAKGTWLGKDGKPKIITTQQMYDRRSSRDRWAIPVAKPLELPAQHLLVDPYTLGVWLGDGAASNAQICCGDEHVLKEVSTREGIGKQTWNGQGAWVTTFAPHIPGTPRNTCGRARLRKLGVLENKHIPDVYLRGSIQQRRDLLAGLLDTDGYVDSKGWVEFTQRRRHIVDDVVKLCWGLGIKCNQPSPKIVNGETYWRINFRPHVPVFKLPRKRDAQRLGSLTEQDRKRAQWRTIESITPCPSIPTQCLTVDSPDHTFCSGHTQVVTHNTFQIAVARTLFILGCDPTARVAIISDTHEQAAKIVRMIAKIIENSPEYKEVFPAVVRGEPWTAHHLHLKRNDGGFMKDPNVIAVGMFGNLSGARLTHMIWDDILDIENTSTAAQRDKVYNWLKSSECMGRLLKNAPIWAIGNAYHPDDALHRLSKEPNWRFMRLPVLDDHGNSTWPERWDQKRIEEKRTDVGPLEFARQMLCRARDDSESRFSRADLDACCARGLGLPFVSEASELCGTPWPLPPGALKAMPELPGGQVSNSVVGFDLDRPDITIRKESAVGQVLERRNILVTESAKALTRQGIQTRKATQIEGLSLSTSGGPRAHSRRARRASKPRARGESLADRTADLFPDSAIQAHKQESLRPGELSNSGGDDVPEWLRNRQRQELDRGGDGGRRGRKGGEDSFVYARVGKSRGQPPPNDRPSSQLPAHNAHKSSPNKHKSTSPSAHKSTAPQQATQPTQAHSPSAAHTNTYENEAAGILLSKKPDSDTPPSENGERLGSENFPENFQELPLDNNTTEPTPQHAVRASNSSDGGVEDPDVNSTEPVLQVPGAPEGLIFTSDSLGWLEEWLADPGTPHRNSDGWPVHPRTVSGLKRLGIEFETGVDLAVQKHSAADFTVVYTIAVYPPHGPHGHRLRRPVEILRGRWYAMDIADRIASAHFRFGSEVTLENVAAQDYIRQILLDKYPDANDWLRGYTTGKQKADSEFGIEKLAAEFNREQWCFPVPSNWHPDSEKADDIVLPEILQNFNEILYYDPREHTGDLLMAQWLAKEGSRLREKRDRRAGVGIRLI